LPLVVGGAGSVLVAAAPVWPSGSVAGVASTDTPKITNYGRRTRQVRKLGMILTSAQVRR
jgi:hypothetical protein